MESYQGVNMCLYIVGNEKYENGSLSFFLEKEFYLPFSLVQLDMVFVHSGPSFCTFTLHFVQKLKQIVQLVRVFVQLHFCTVGYVCCTIGLYLCAIGCLICTLGSLKCTNGVKT